MLVEPPKVPAAYLVSVRKPIPESSGEAVIKDLIKSGPAGRAFLLYVDALSASWDNLYADRQAVRQLVERDEHSNSSNP